MSDDVMITGGSGFIGKAVMASLAEHAVSAYAYDLHDGNDVMDADGVDRDVKQFSAVIHLAGVLGTHELFDSPERAISINVQGSLNVIEACAKHGVPYIGISMPDAFPSVYTATKIAAVRLAEAYGHSMGLRYGHVVAYNAFGPGQAYGPGHPQKIVPTFAVACKNNVPMPIWGDGSQGVDLIHIDALAEVFFDALRWALDKRRDNGAVFQGGSGRGFTVLEVARHVAEFAGVDPLVRFLPMRRGEVPTNIKSSNPHLAIPRDTVLKQLRETVEWYMGGVQP